MKTLLKKSSAKGSVKTVFDEDNPGTEGAKKRIRLFDQYFWSAELIEYQGSQVYLPSKVADGHQRIR